MSRRWPDKLVIGLTGNIATGKSVIMRLAAEQGALTLDADKMVHQILDTDPLVQRKIEAAFDGDLRHPDGSINRRKLGAIVFEDRKALGRLERIVHPKVRKLLASKVDSSLEPVVVIEAIKLLESGLAADCDVIWVTRCSEETQLQRLMICRGMDETTARARVNSQTAQAKKVAVADVVIDTDGTMVETEKYFQHAWHRLTKTLMPVEIPRSGARKQTVGQVGEPAAMMEAVADLGQLIVRRAKPADIPSILWLIQQATDGSVTMKRSELLAALGERGYLIGQLGTQISTVAGWHADNQVAAIEEFYISTPDAAKTTGTAVLEEIESTAQSLLCEVILVVTPRFSAKKISNLFQDHGYEVANTVELPKSWQAALAGSGPEEQSILMKVLRETRVAAK